MYSNVPSRPTGYLIKYNLFTTISELSDLYTKRYVIRTHQKDNQIQIGQKGSDNKVIIISELT